MNTNDWDDLLFLFAAGALEDGEREEVEAWLATRTPEVQRALARAEDEVALLAGTVAPVAASPAVRERLRARIATAHDARRDTSRASLATPPRRSGRSVLQRPVLAAGVAAILAAALGGILTGVLARRESQARETMLNAEIASTKSEIAQLRSDLDETRKASDEVHDEIAELEARHRTLETDLVLANKAIMVLRSDRMQSLALTGTPALPDAHGRVFWDWKNWYCYLHAEGFTPDPARTYAMWLFSENGDVIGVGTFHANASGEATFLGPVPHDVGHVVRAGVSLEPDEDLGPKPRGTVVMIGKAS